MDKSNTDNCKANTEEQIVTDIPIDCQSTQFFFRVPPDSKYRLMIWDLKDKDNRDIYLPDPKLWNFLGFTE